jgi:hypothetical protein
MSLVKKKRKKRIIFVLKEKNYLLYVIPNYSTPYICCHVLTLFIYIYIYRERERGGSPSCSSIGCEPRLIKRRSQDRIPSPTLVWTCQKKKKKDRRGGGGGGRTMTEEKRGLMGRNASLSNDMASMWLIGS